MTSLFNITVFYLKKKKKKVSRDFVENGFWTTWFSVAASASGRVAARGDPTNASSSSPPRWSWWVLLKTCCSSLRIVHERLRLTLLRNFPVDEKFRAPGNFGGKLRSAPEVSRLKETGGVRIVTSAPTSLHVRRLNLKGRGSSCFAQSSWIDRGVVRIPLFAWFNCSLNDVRYSKEFLSLLSPRIFALSFLSLL